MSPAIIPANPVFAPLSLFTADLEKDPVWHVQNITNHLLTNDHHKQNTIVNCEIQNLYKYEM